MVPFRSQRPAVGGVPGQLSRQNASLAFSVCHSRCLIWSLPVAPHDAVIVAGMFAIPALIALWIVNRMRHPERGLLHALVIASVGFVLVPCVSSAVLILWVRTGGNSIQAAFVSMFVYFFGFWGFRRWLRSAPRAARPAKALVAPAVHAAPRSGLAGEVAELRAEVARLRAERQDRGGRNMPEPIPVILLGQLAVDTDYQGRGLGSDLLIDAGKRALTAADVIGARAIVVQAFDEDAKKFYAPFGFLPFSDREPLMLILRISELRVALQS